jgi:hypothetical protein
METTLFFAFFQDNKIMIKIIICRLFFLFFPYFIFQSHFKLQLNFSNIIFSFKKKYRNKNTNRSKKIQTSFWILSLLIVVFTGRANKNILFDL